MKYGTIRNDTFVNVGRGPETGTATSAVKITHGFYATKTRNLHANVDDDQAAWGIARCGVTHVLELPSHCIARGR